MIKSRCSSGLISSKSCFPAKSSGFSTLCSDSFSAEPFSESIARTSDSVIISASACSVANLRTKFCNSRKLPVHGKFSSSSSAEGSIWKLFRRLSATRSFSSPAMTSARIFSFCSRSGIVPSDNTLRRSKRSARNSPRATISRKLRDVATMILKSTGISRLAPTRRIHFSSTAFKSLACRLKESSPTSSRKTVPPLPISKSPAFIWFAPVNAPFS